MSLNTSTATAAAQVEKASIRRLHAKLHSVHLSIGILWGIGNKCTDTYTYSEWKDLGTRKLEWLHYYLTGSRLAPQLFSSHAPLECGDPSRQSDEGAAGERN